MAILDNDSPNPGVLGLLLGLTTWDEAIVQSLDMSSEYLERVNMEFHSTVGPGVPEVFSFSEGDPTMMGDNYEVFSQFPWPSVNSSMPLL